MIFIGAPPGSYGHPDINPGERQPSEGWLERAGVALTFTGPDTGFAKLVNRFQRMMRF